MNIRLVAVALSFFLFISCSPNKEIQEKAPENLLTEEKMAEIVSEIQLIEAYLNQIPYSKRGANDSDYFYYSLLFEKYKVNKDDFMQNLKYYATQEDKISSIYDKSIILLNKVKAKDLEIRLEMKLDSIRQDSIKEIAEIARVDSLRATLKKDKKQN